MTNPQPLLYGSEPDTPTPPTLTFKPKPHLLARLAPPPPPQAQAAFRAFEEKPHAPTPLNGWIDEFNWIRDGATFIQFTFTTSF